MRKSSQRKTFSGNYITQSHPRTAIGYYEPGHYCILVVDGRQPELSRGMFLKEMSQLFADLECKAAYNLDGGHCSFMARGTSYTNKPYKPSKEISDGIFICEPGRNHRMKLGRLLPHLTISLAEIKYRFKRK